MRSVKPSQTLGLLGGPQGPKALLDSVLQAVREGNLEALGRLSKNFLAVDDNVAKCIDEGGNTIAHLALHKNCSTLQFVIEELHANVNAPNFQGRTPLHEAVTKNYVECCEVLLQYGADDSVQSATLSTPFHTAAACGSVECMDVLLQHSEDALAKVNELDLDRSSALHKCAFDGDVRVSRWLIEHGAAVNARDNMEITPLLEAVRMGQREVTEYLLTQKANCNQRDVQGNTCVHFCAIRCDPAILKILLDAGASVQVQNEELNNPLHVAALYQRPDSSEWETLIAVLLQAGCDPDQENAAKKKPSDYVGRGLKKLFTMAEVERRQQQASQLQKDMEENAERAIAQWSSWRTQVLQDVNRVKQLELMEEERLAREREEYVRAERDAQVALEEVVEMNRYLEDEIAKKKAILEKSKGTASATK